MNQINKKLWITALVSLVLLDCGLGAFVATWREWYWQSLINKEFYKWALYIGEFSVVALVSCFVSGISSYIGNRIGLQYRDEFTLKALDLNNHAEIEGGAQRVQEDCNSYPQLFIQLLTGLFRSVIMMVVFFTIIMIQLPIVYVCLPLAYSILGTLLAAKVAHPLIALNYLNQVYEAKFRQVLTNTNYLDVHNNNLQMFKKLKHLQYFQSFYSQITVIIPHILLLFVYFSGKITFGVFMQVASSMGELIGNMSYFVNNFDTINRFLSCRKRLKELKII